MSAEQSLRQILEEMQKQTSILQQIAAGVEQLTEPNYFNFEIEGTMTDLQIFDDGKGFKITATPDKPLKAGETTAWSASDPTAVVLEPDPNDPDTPTHISIVGTLPTPPKDVTGLVVTLKATRLDSVVISDDAPAIDIVPDPNGEVGGFVFQEAAL